MTSYSSKTKAAGTLARVTTRQARHFLFALVNLRDELEAGRHFLLRFMEGAKDGLEPKILRDTAAVRAKCGGKNNCILSFRDVQSIVKRTLDAWEHAPEPHRSYISCHTQLAQGLFEWVWLPPLRNAVRAIWEAPDKRQKQRRVFYLLERLADSSNSLLVESSVSFYPPGQEKTLPPPTPFEQVMLYLLREDVHTSRCANRECPAPYFFPRRQGQKYCSIDCALPAQRKYKRDWWSTKGKEWRKWRNNKHLGKNQK